MRASEIGDLRRIGQGDQRVEEGRQQEEIERLRSAPMATTAILIGIDRLDRVGARALERALQPRRERATDPGEDKEAGEHHGDRIEWVTEEEDEALDVRRSR